MKKAIYSLIAALCLLPLSASAADSAAVLDAKVDDAIERFKRDVNGADVFLHEWRFTRPQFTDDQHRDHASQPTPKGQPPDVTTKRIE